MNIPTVDIYFTPTTSTITLVTNDDNRVFSIVDGPYTLSALTHAGHTGMDLLASTLHGSFASMDWSPHTMTADNMIVLYGKCDGEKIVCVFYRAHDTVLLKCEQTLTHDITQQDMDSLVIYMSHCHVSQNTDPVPPLTLLQLIPHIHSTEKK